MSKRRYSTRSATQNNDFNDGNDQVQESSTKNVKTGKTKRKYSKKTDARELPNNDNDPTISEGSSIVAVSDHGKNSKINIFNHTLLY